MRINTDKNCRITIFDDTEYPVKGMEYENSASLYIVQLNKSTGSSIIYNKLDTHTNSNGKPIKLDEVTGGFISVCHIVLPKLDSSSEVPDEWFDEYVKVKNYITNDDIDSVVGQQNNIVALMRGDTKNATKSGTVYYTDGHSIYRMTYGDEAPEEVDVLELIEVNADSYNFYKSIQNFFSVCSLRKCYISLCQKIFNDRGFNRCFLNKVSSLSIYKRDLVWAALNVIQYMIDSNQLAEAQRLLERIMGCNGLCSSEDTGEQGCGCE